MPEALEPFPEVRSLGRNRIQGLCDEWCNGPQAKEFGVSAIQVDGECLGLSPVFLVDAKGFDKGETLHFPFDRVLGFIIDQGCPEPQWAALKERLRALRQKVGPYLFQRYKVNRQAFTMALRCPACSHLLLTDIRVFEGQPVQWTGNEECTCPRCSVEFAVQPGQVFPVIDPGFAAGPIDD